MSIECDCGKVNSFNEIKCIECGKVLHTTDEKDKYVILRQEKLQPISLLIKTNDMLVKNIRISIRDHTQEKVHIEDFISLVGSYCNKIQNDVNNDVFSNINLRYENFNNPELNIKLNEIETLINNAYDIYEDLILTEFPDIWQNAYNRFLNTIEKYVNALKYFVYAFLANTLDELNEKQKIAQEYIDSSSQDILVLSNIIKVKQLNLNFEMFKDGKINNSSIMSMIVAGSNFEDVADSYSNLQSDVYNYFKDFLTNSFESYREKNTLLLLSASKLMGILSFRENIFFEKIKITIDLLEKAYQKDRDNFKRFFNKTNVKFKYALSVITNMSEDVAFTFSYNASSKLIIKNALGWYKELTEGVFRDISNILVFSAKILDHKTITEDSYNTILEDESFPEKLEYLSQKKKLRLQKLTEGIERIIRHAEAHVDYSIDAENERITLKNKSKETGTITELSYTFIEFINLENICAESIFSIITGICIFMLNHQSEFLSNIEETLEYKADVNAIDLIFPLMGVVIEEKEIVPYTENTSLLRVKGVSTGRTDYNFIKKCIPCVALLNLYENNIEIVSLSFFDINDTYIGSIQINLGYIKEYYKISENLKKYNSLLTLLTSKIDYPKDQSLAEEKGPIYGITFIKSIVVLANPLLEKLSCLKSELLLNGVTAKCNIKPTKDEMLYILKTCDEYKDYVSNDKLLTYSKSIFSKIIESLQAIMRSSKNNINNTTIRSFNEISKEIFAIADIEKMITNGENDSSVLSFFEYNSVKSNKTSFKVGRNDPCPCGSGKKYKKCCLDKDQC